MNREYKIDEELNELLPMLTEDEYKELENSLLKDGFKGAPIIIWNDIIIDGHNRYQICKKHNIPFEIKEMKFESKGEVMEWMIRAQLGRRNLENSQKIQLVRRFKEKLEKKAKENQSKAGGDRKSENYQKSVTEILPQAINDTSENKRNPTVAKQLADMIGVSEKTFRMGSKVLESEDEELKNQMLSGKKSINASYKEIKRLEKEGRVPVVTEQNENKTEAKSIISDKKKNDNTQKKLCQIKEQYPEYFEKFQDYIQWLQQKEFYSEDGDELTSRIRSELNACIGGLESFYKIIDNLQTDDYDDDVIIVQK